MQTGHLISGIPVIYLPENINYTLTTVSYPPKNNAAVKSRFKNPFLVLENQKTVPKHVQAQGNHITLFYVSQL
jgi:hypothetical protein